MCIHGCHVYGCPIDHDACWVPGLAMISLAMRPLSGYLRSGLLLEVPAVLVLLLCDLLLWFGLFVFALQFCPNAVTALLILL